MNKKEYLSLKLKDKELGFIRKKYTEFLFLIILTIVLIPILTTICFILKNLYIYVITGISTILFAFLDIISYTKVYMLIYNYNIDCIKKDLKIFLNSKKSDDEDTISSEVEEKFSEKLYDMEKIALYNEHIEPKNLNFLNRYILNDDKEIEVLYDNDIIYTPRGSHKVINYYFFLKTDLDINTFIEFNSGVVNCINKDIKQTLEEGNNNNLTLSELDKNEIEKLLEISKKYDVHFNIYIKDNEMIFVIYFYNYTPLRIKSIIKQNYNILNAINEIKIIIHSNKKN